jgi:hypothetical protein
MSCRACVCACALLFLTKKKNPNEIIRSLVLVPRLFIIIFFPPLSASPSLLCMYTRAQQSRRYIIRTVCFVHFSVQFYWRRTTSAIITMTQSSARRPYRNSRYHNDIISCQIIIISNSVFDRFWRNVSLCWRNWLLIYYYYYFVRRPCVVTVHTAVPYDSNVIEFVGVRSLRIRSYGKYWEKKQYFVIEFLPIRANTQVFANRTVFSVIENHIIISCSMLLLLLYTVKRNTNIIMVLYYSR